MMQKAAFYKTVAELAAAGPERVPAELISTEHVIYNSPASLSFNSPGAEGFGVKRAGLAIPGSIMLLVGPGCCGRNTTILSEMSGYSDRFFFYTMDETDIITSRHLQKIPQAIREICESSEKAPSVVMVCMTCVDALLGTDMERVCRKAADEVGIPVVPCYMYALTREGRKPLLKSRKRRGDAVNLLGYFSPLQDDCELYDLLKQAGVKHIREISRCGDFDEYLAMSEANFNIVLHPESRLAAQDMEERLQIPSIELTRMYDTEKIHKQYGIFSKVIGVSLDDRPYKEEAEAAVEEFLEKYGSIRVAIGEMMNGDVFDMAAALSKYGLDVREIYGTVTAESFVRLRQLAETNGSINETVDLAIGKDAAYYHPKAAHVFWNQEIQPFGHRGVTTLFHEMTRAMEGHRI